MTKAERLKRWRAVLSRRNMSVKEAAGRLKIAPQVAYNWNCGNQLIPEKRVLELEGLK